MHFVNNQRPKIRSVYYQSHETTEKEAPMGMRNYFSRLNVVYRKSTFPSNRRVIAERFPVKNQSSYVVSIYLYQCKKLNDCCQGLTKAIQTCDRMALGVFPNCHECQKIDFHK